MLLFLKNIESIEISYWNAEDSERERIFFCSILDISLELRNKRSYVGSNLKTVSVGETDPSQHIRTVDFTMRLSCESTDNSTGVRTYTEHWEVCNQLGGVYSSRIAADPANALLRLVPWGGVAVCVCNDDVRVIHDSNHAVTSSGGDGYSTPSTPSLSITAATTSTSSVGHRSGLAYCFLPLPILTGLPVMVNGFFELSSNRRDIWQSGQAAGGEMTGDGRTRAEWNLSLMRDVIAPSYVRMLLRSKDLLGFSNFYQELFPKETSFPWSVVVESTLHGCKREKLLYVESAPTVQSDAVGAWVECDRAVLIPTVLLLNDSKLSQLTSEHEELLSSFVLNIGQPLARCSASLGISLSTSKTCGPMALPAFSRNVLREYYNSGQDYTHFITASTCSSFLLQYCLSDLDPSLPSDCTQLNSLPLLPLKGGRVGTIRILSTEHAECVRELCSMGFSYPRSVWALSKNSFDIHQACDLLSSTTDESFAVIETAESFDRTYGMYVLANAEISGIFSSGAAVLIDTSQVSHNVCEFLENEIVQQLSNIRTFEGSLIPTLLKHILPTCCFCGSAVTVMSESSACESVQSSLMHSFTQGELEGILDFLPVFWSKVLTSDDYMSSIAEGAAIVPYLSSPSSPSSPSSVSLAEKSINTSANSKSNSHNSEEASEAVVVRRNVLRMCPLSRMFSLLAGKRGDVILTDQVSDLLLCLGVRIVDSSILGNTDSATSVFWQYVHSPNRTGVLTAVDTVMRNKNREVLSGTTANVVLHKFPPLCCVGLSATQKESLKLYLSTCEPLQQLSGTYYTRTTSEWIITFRGNLAHDTEKQKNMI